jgi:hypothetical protein
MFSLVKIDSTSHIDRFSITIPNFYSYFIDIRNCQENGISLRKRKSLRYPLQHSAVQLTLLLYL